MSNIVPLFPDKEKEEEKEEECEPKLELETSGQLLRNMRINKEKEERLRKEREQANKSVLRSYRIKS
jgi:hypothetical protein